MIIYLVSATISINGTESFNTPMKAFKSDKDAIIYYENWDQIKQDILNECDENVEKIYKENDSVKILSAGLRAIELV